MKAQTMLILPFSVVGAVYRAEPDKIVSCARVNSKIVFDDHLSLKVSSLQNINKSFLVLAFGIRVCVNIVWMTFEIETGTDTRPFCNTVTIRCAS